MANMYFISLDIRRVVEIYSPMDIKVAGNPSRLTDFMLEDTH